MLRDVGTGIVFIAMAFLSWGCQEFAYDPSASGDVAISNAKEMPEREIDIEEEIALVGEQDSAAFTAEDLSQAKTFAVSELLDLALSNYPSTRVSWHAARAAAYGVREAASVYYPTITADEEIIVSKEGSNNSSSNAISQTNGVSSLNTSTSTNGGGGSGGLLLSQLSASYLLFDFGGRHAQVELAYQQLVAANWQHNLAIQQVLMTLLSGYISFLGNKALVIADELDLKDAEVALAAAKKMNEAGLATFTDVLQAQAIMEQKKLALNQAIAAEKSSLSQLLIAVGLPPEAPIKLEQLPDQLPIIKVKGDLASLVDLAKRKRPDLGAALAAVRQQEAQLAISYSAGMPTVTAAATLGRLHFIHNSANDQTIENVSVDLNIPIFQGFYYLNQQRQLQEQIKSTLATMEVQASQIALNVVTNYYAWQSALAAIPSTEAYLNYSQRAYQGLLIQYKTGTASILDVLTALTTLSDARAQQVMARTQWAASLVNLAFSVGILEKEIF